MLEKTTRVNLLYDHYGGLLTEKQRRFVELHYVEDWSLGEIAEQCGISRQAVHDHLKRAVDQLEQYETVLGLVDRQARRRILAARLSEEVEALPVEGERKRRLLGLIRRMAEDGDGVEDVREGEGRHV